MTANEIMSKNVACCTSDTTLRDCAKMMAEHDCGCIPIVENMEDKRVIGVITDRDLACRAIAQGKDPNVETVAPYMSTDVITCNSSMSVQECESRMEARQVRRVPIVNESGSIVGIVSQADIALSRGDAEIADVVRKVSKPYLM
jgi:CBS domain-containing protein